MIIEAIDKVGDHRTGTLSNMTAEDIARVLGFEANCQDDPDKVKYSWGFEADGVHCGIWDYYKSYTLNSWSLYGPKEVFEKLFGKENVR
jgi:hypothetical protein